MTSVLGAVDRRALHVMTLNVRRPLGALAFRRADRWHRRRPLLSRLLERERPAVLACQEVVPRQVAAITEGLGTSYRYVGHGRSAGRRGEGCPIFFDHERLELVEWEQVALSDHPDRPGSRSWGNPIPRILVTAVFRDRAGGASVAVLNTHLDPFSACSRIRSAHVLRARTEALGIPAVVTGDLNDRPGSPAVRALLADEVLRDAWAIADAHATPEWATFGRYRPPRPGDRIDWIAVTPGIRVLRAAIGGHPVGGGWASDHLPVHAAVLVDGRTP